MTPPEEERPTRDFAVLANLDVTVRAKDPEQARGLVQALGARIMDALKDGVAVEKIGLEVSLYAGTPDRPTGRLLGSGTWDA